MILIRDLIERIRTCPAFVMQDDYTKLFGPTPEARINVMIQVIKQSLRDYEIHELYDKLITIAVANNRYVFYENLTEDEETTVLIPKAIVYVKGGTVSGLGVALNPWAAGNRMIDDYGTRINGRMWQYNRPVLDIMYSGILLVRALYSRPFVYTITNDNLFSEDSRIYYLDMENIQFIDQVTVNMLKQVKLTKESVSLNSSVNFLQNIDQNINMYESRINDYYRTNLKGLSAWRK